MKYYEMHEKVYSKLKEEGKISWDNSTSFNEMWNHETNVYLKKFFDNKALSFKKMKVLDLGTGTGTSALFTAKEGAFSTGVEISSSAIEIAKENSKALGLDVSFIHGDVLDLSLKDKFDLVIDSTILHCLVGPDRHKFYQVVHQHLNTNGLFFINTMLASEDMENRFPKEYFLFRDDILWSLGISEIQERREIDGKSYFPHRTILTKEKQFEELSANGFIVEDKSLIKDEDGGFNLKALLSKASSGPL